MRKQIILPAVMWMLLCATTMPAAQGMPMVALLVVDDTTQAGFSPDGKTALVISKSQGQVHLHNAATGEEINRLGDKAHLARFSGDGKKLVVAGEDGTIRIFDTRTGRAIKRMEGAAGGSRVKAMALSLDGSTLLTATEGDQEKKIQIWETASGKPVSQLQSECGPVTALAISSDGAYALSAGGIPMVLMSATSKPTANKSNFVAQWWNLKSGQPEQRFELNGATTSAQIATGGKLVLVQSANSAVMYDVATGKETPAPRNPDERFMATDHTADRTLTIRAAMGSAVIIESQSGVEKVKLEGAIDGLPISWAFSQDGKRVALGTGKVAFFSRKPDEPGSVHVFEVATGKSLGQFMGHKKQVVQVMVGEGAVLSRDAGGQVRLWALEK